MTDTAETTPADSSTGTGPAGSGHGAGNLAAYSNALRRAWLRLAARYREWRLGIDTGGSIDAARLSGAPGAYGYQPIPFDVFDAALLHVPIDPNDDAFLDIGCGKGRAVVLAALRPFRRVIGVELSPELCCKCRDNVRRANRFIRARQIEILQVDALAYDIPSDVSVVHLFNPFDEAVLAQVLHRVHRSLVAAPRRLTIVLTLPRQRRDLPAETDWLTSVVEVATARDRWLRTVVYRADQLASSEP